MSEFDRGTWEQNTAERDRDRDLQAARDKAYMRQQEREEKERMAISAHRHEGWQITFGGPNDPPYCDACGHYLLGRVVDAVGPFRIKEYDTVLQPGTADPYCVVWNVDVEPARRYTGMVSLHEARRAVVAELERFWDI